MPADTSEVVVSIDGAAVPPAPDLTITFEAPAGGPPRVVLMRGGAPVTGRWRVALYAEQTKE